ncbi:MAG: DMT family transporter [Anaerolineae bacterium]|nr:DMT family transporter [Anaerolineae bacterium]
MIIQPELAAVAFGVLASASWGISDFSGGMATKRSAVIGVVAVAHGFGLLLLIALATLSGEALPPTTDLLWGALAGLAGAVGLSAFYQALASGRMGIAAPITSILAAALPVLVGIATHGFPKTLQLIGIAIGMVSVWLISYSSGKAQMQTLLLAVMAGFGFGGFLVLIDQVVSNAVFWPLVAARAASTTLMFGLVFSRRIPLPQGRGLLPFVLMAGGLDVAGNIFFVLATQAGRLDLAAVVSSLYPAITVLLARLMLKEPVARLQFIGIFTALVAVSLIAL